MIEKRCPRCKIGIKSYVFACRDCWPILPENIQQMVLSSAKLGPDHPDRRRAVQRAQDYYDGYVRDAS